MTVHGLLTDHFVRRRLALARYTSVRAELDEWATKAKSASGWQARIQALGYQLQQLPSYGWLASASGRRVLVIHPQPSRDHFARMDETGRLPEGALVTQCQAQGASYGLLTAGDAIRLFPSSADRGAATDRWLEIDPASLDSERLYLLGLLAPGSLGENGRLQELLADSQAFGAELYTNLDEQIRKHALPQFGRGLGQWMADVEGADLKEPATRQLIQQATYTLLFRLLFTLYGESADYLPYEQSVAYTNGSLRNLCEDARRRRDDADPKSTFLWDGLRRLTRALGTGDSAMSLPAYNGSLFHPADLPGAELLERASVSDAYLAPALDALGYDYRNTDQELGIDYAQLGIGHLGAIYEGLLALRLSLADQTYRWDRARDRFLPANEAGEDGVAEGELFFQTEAGGRKGGGVYYTRQELVRHLVNQAVLPALDEHLKQVRKRAETNPADAARLLFRFRVLDPAMGSAHFLVDALDVIADRVEKFLAETPLPAIRGRLAELRALAHASEEAVEDGRLLRRLLLKHCIYGVDLSEMATELGRVALWLASFVPGLALSYLSHNIKQGNSLVGLTSLDFLAKRGFLWASSTGPAATTLKRLSDIGLDLADMEDRTAGEVEQYRDLEDEMEAVGEGLQRAFDLWTAEPFGVSGARDHLLDAESILSGGMKSDVASKVEAANRLSEDRHFFHWPLAFPEVFHPSSERNPGFDAVIGNPPWDEFALNELSFFALHDPGVRGLRTEAGRRVRVEKLLKAYPELRSEFEHMKIQSQIHREFFKPENGYEIQGAGHLDLYELFCERYQSLTRSGGRIGVVQPRSTFLSKGSLGFRRWLFGKNAVSRIDFILNKARWAFDMEPRYTVALLAAHVSVPPKGHVVTVSGPAENLSHFQRAVASPGVAVSLDDLAVWTPPPPDTRSQEPTWELPLLPTEAHARLYAKLRTGPRFDRWGRGNGAIFPVQGDVNETTHKRLFGLATGTPVWKGGSFDQYDPHGRDPAGYGDKRALLRFIVERRSGSRSYRLHFPKEHLADPDTHPIHRARVAFRDVSRATDSRTVRACLIPLETPLTHQAPYLVFAQADASKQAFVLGVFNSLPFDWQARRFVETHFLFFILNLLSFPPDESRSHEIALRAARLSCPDDRLSEFAKDVGVGCGPLSPAETRRPRAEIDALVAHAYRLTAEDLEFVFTDFTTDAVPNEYRALVLQCFEELK